MNDLRHDPNVTFVTVSDSHGVYEEIDVRAAQQYDTRTSSDRIDELNAQMAALRAEMRALSEQMQAGR